MSAPILICDLAARKRRTEMDAQIGPIEDGRRPLARANLDALSAGA